MGLLRSPDGTIVNVPDDAEGSARANGYTPVSLGEAGATTGALTPEDTGITGGINAAATGALSGLTLGGSDIALKGLLDRGEFDRLAASRAQHPYAAGAGELAGMLLPSLATGGASAGIGAEGLGARILARSPAAGVSRVGAAVSGLGEGAGLLGRTAAASAGAAAEGALYGGGQYLSQTALEDKPLSAEGFVGAMGNGALFAAPVGGAFTLAESALVRARSLFPRSEMTAAAGREAQHEATSQLGQTLSDGDAMAAAAKQKIGLADAKQGMAASGEQVTRSAFGHADPQSLVDQAAHGAESRQVADALQKFETSKAKFNEWVHTEADPELEAALSGLQAPGVQGSGGLPMIEPGVPVGEFGAPGAPGIKSSDELVPRQVTETGTPVPTQEPTRAGRPAAFAEGTPAGRSSPVAPVSEPLSDTEYQTYKTSYAGAANDHLPAEMFYSKGGDEIVNPELRSGKPLSEQAEKLRDQLDAAFSLPESRLPREATLYRGMSDDPFLGTKGMKARFANVKPGDAIEDPAFTSTAYSAKAKSRNEEIVFTIRAPAGTPALPIRSKFSSEGELLLPRNTKLRVDRIEYVPVSERWHMPEKFEVMPDKSVKMWERDGSVTVRQPIKDIHATVVSDHAPPAAVPRAIPVDLSAPIDRLSLRQIGEYQGALNKAFDSATQGTPEYAELSAKWDAAAARRSGIADGKIRDVEHEYVPPAAAAAPTDSLSGLLRGTHEKLAAGGSLSEMGAPARAEYSAAKAARASDAVEHFRAQAMARNYAGSEMAAAERGMRGETTAIKRTLRARIGKDVDMSAQLSRAAEAIGGVESASADLAEALGADAPAGAAARAADYRTAVRQQAEVSSAGTARLAGDLSHKLPSSGPELMKLFGLEGADSSAGAVGNAADLKALLSQWSEENTGTVVDRAMRDRMRPVADAAAVEKLARKPVGSAADKTAVTGDVERALQKHESAIEGAKDRALVSMQRAESKAAAKEAAAGARAPAPAAAPGRSVGSELSTAATAFEVLKAMGVHVPAMSSIPVIGPVLGAYFKAKAVMSILGRKGGSIPSSTESVIAAKAAETRDRIVSATKTIITTGIKVGKVAGPATASILAMSLFPGGKKAEGGDPQALYHARMDELAMAQSPGALHNEISSRFQTSDPALVDAITAQVERGIAFLDKKAPKQTMLPGMIPGDGEWHPSKAALDEWAKYVRAVNDPASVLEDLANGHITMEGAETLRVVYPLLFAEAQHRLLEAAPQMRKTLPYPARVAISIMYQIPLDGTMTAQHIQFLSHVPGQPVAPAQGPPPGAPAITGPITLGQRTMTSLDRRAGS